MVYELMKVEYYVIDRRVYRESDAPHCGMTLVIPKGEEEHGPFGTKRMAKRSMGELEKKMIGEGWSKIEREDDKEKKGSELYDDEGVHAYLCLQRRVLDARPIADITVKRLNLWT